MLLPPHWNSTSSGHLCSKKRTAPGCGIALCRKTRQVVAYAIGDRSKETCLRLWEAIPSAYREGHCFTDFWAAYTAVIPEAQHSVVGKETGETAHVERWNNTLRQCLASFVRIMKALHTPACAAPGARPVEKQVEEPPALADPSTTISAPRVSTVDTNAAHPVAPSPGAVDPDPTRAALRVSTVDKNAAYPKAIIEQDQRLIKRLVKPGMGFFSFETAGRTLQGDQSMHLIRTGQMHGVVKGDIPGQVTFMARLFRVAA